MANKQAIDNSKHSKSEDTGSNELEDHNIYLFMKDFEAETVEPVIEFILKKNLLPDSKRPEYLTLMICSPGGDLHSCFALIDIMKASVIPIRTIGLGQIASCGILTFMAGEKGHRVLTPNTSILSHQWSWYSDGKEHELFARQKEFGLTKERMLTHYKNCTGMTEKIIKTYLLPSQDIWLSADEAVKYGIADSIKKV